MLGRRILGPRPTPARATTRKRGKGPGQSYQLLLQPVLMPRSWYLWPAAIKGKGFGTGLKHYPVPKPQYRHRLVHQPVPKEQGGIGTGWWNQPVPKGWTMAPGFAMARCRHVSTTKAPVGNINRFLCLFVWHRLLSTNRCLWATPINTPPPPPPSCRELTVHGSWVRGGEANFCFFFRKC